MRLAKRGLLGRGRHSPHGINAAPSDVEAIRAEFIAALPDAVSALVLRPIEAGVRVMEVLRLQPGLDRRLGTFIARCQSPDRSRYR